MAGNKNSGRHRTYRTQIDMEIKQHPERIGVCLDAIINAVVNGGNVDAAKVYLDRVLGLSTAKVQIEAHIMTADAYASETMRIQALERQLIAEHTDIPLLEECNVVMSNSI